MANDIVVNLPPSFGGMSKHYQTHAPDDSQEYSAGVSGGYSVISMKGKTWAVKHAGERHVVRRRDAQGNETKEVAGLLRVVIIRGNPALSKTYYENGYSDGDDKAPDCWSLDGLAPPQDVPKRQSDTCVSCPKNQWGSRVSASGKKAKACSDQRRLAVVPLEDMANEAFGGPMLLRIAPTSLADLKAYADRMRAAGYALGAIGTEIGFDPDVAHPKLTFGPIRALTDQESALSLMLRESSITHSVLAMDEGEAAAPVSAEVHELPKAAPPPPRVAAPPKAVQPEPEPEVQDEAVVEPPKAAVPPPPAPKAKAPPPPPPRKVEEPKGPVRPTDPSLIAHAGTEDEHWYIDNVWVPAPTAPPTAEPEVKASAPKADAKPKAAPRKAAPPAAAKAADEPATDAELDEMMNALMPS